MMTTTWWDLNGGGVLEFDTNPPIDLRRLRFGGVPNLLVVLSEALKTNVLPISTNKSGTPPAIPG